MTVDKHRHIIHQQHIEVGMPAGKSPYALQERIRNIYYERIIPQLEKVFSGAAGEDTIIRIDRLHVDVGAVNADKLEEELTEIVVRAVQKSLEDKLQFEVTDSGHTEVVNVRRSAGEMLLYFLINGRLPWWSVVEELAELEEMILRSEEGSFNIAERLLRLLEEDKYVLDRLIFQFSDTFLRWVLKVCYPGMDPLREGIAGDGAARDRRWRAVFHRAVSGGMTGASYDRDAWKDEDTEKASDAVAGPMDKDPHRQDDEAKEWVENGKGSDEKIVSQDVPEVLPREDEEVLSKKRWEAGGASDEKVDGGMNIRKPEVGEDRDEDVESGEKAAVMTGRDPDEAGRPGVERIEKKDDKERDDRERRERKIRRAPDDEDALYLESAGLVLLHPFLTPFFDGLQLLEGKAFRDEDAREKGVHLLGYLSTGEEEIEEHRLLFPKVLCGMELAQPVRKMGVLSPEERKEVEHLLAVVIDYWKALKSTSAAGLRASFLQRQGKLSRKEDGWQLDVEKKTWDILLGGLPWGYSIIRLPWMKEMVFVNWG